MHCPFLPACWDLRVGQDLCVCVCVVPAWSRVSPCHTWLCALRSSSLVAALCCTCRPRLALASCRETKLAQLLPSLTRLFPTCQISTADDSQPSVDRELRDVCPRQPQPSSGDRSQWSEAPTPCRRAAPHQGHARTCRADGILQRLFKSSQPGHGDPKVRRGGPKKTRLFRVLLIGDGR